MSDAPAEPVARHRRPTPLPVRSPLEGPLWLLAGLLLAAAMTWPLVRRLSTTVPQDAGDPVAQAWQAAWGGHALRTQPGRLFEGNTFFPATPSLAFSDSLLGYAPAGLFGSGTGAALIRYNLLFLFAYALCFAGAALLAREIGVRVPAAAVAGIAYAYAPWRMPQNGHLNILSTGGVALALFLLLSGYRRGRAWQIAAGWLVAAWQVSLGFALGIWFCYLLAGLAVCTAVRWWVRGRPAIPRGVVLATLGGGVVLLAVAGALARPYLDVVNANPDAARGLAEVKFFSPPLRSLLAADASSRVWGEATKTIRETLPWAPEMALFPGVLAVILGVVGLRWRGVPRWVRGGLLVALGAVLVLSFGFAFLGGRLYEPLYDTLPGWDGLRTPGRLAFVWTLILAVLAAMGAQRTADGIARWGRLRGTTSQGVVLSVAATLALACAVLYEGSPRLPLAVPLAPPPGLAGLAGPIANLPTNPGADSTFMWWSTDGFPQIGNGNGSYVPPTLAAFREQTQGFPDAPSVDLLRSQGFRTVVVHRALVPGTPWEAAPDKPVDGLGLTRDDRGAFVVFTLS